MKKRLIRLAKQLMEIEKDDKPNLNKIEEITSEIIEFGGMPALFEVDEYIMKNFDKL